MDICILEHPRILSTDHFNDIANTPLWSCLMGGYAASALRTGGFSVTCLDAAVQGLDFDSSLLRLTELAPDLLSINAVYFWERTGRLLDFIQRVKEELPIAHINLFGFFPTLAPQAILNRCPAVDSICVGECENILVELAEALERGAPWQEVPGLAFVQADEIVRSPDRSPEADPDKFPFPERYPGVPSAEDKTAVVLASRGCYNHCTFCPIPVFYNHGPLWRGRSVENILLEVTQLMDAGYRRFYFVDPNFVGPGRVGRRRTLALMQGLGPLRIRFGMETRPNDLDEPLMDAMVQAGLESLLLGIESASAGVLGDLSKHGSAQVSRQAIQLCRRAGIEPEVGFLMHTPDTTVSDLDRNLSFLEENHLLDRLERTANLLCHRQIVFSGTKGFEMYARQGRIIGTDPLGFQAQIAWQDSRALWVADVMVPVCLDVLRRMCDPNSPLFWKNAAVNHQLFKAVNDGLFNQFRQILKMADRSSHLPSVGTVIRQVREVVFESLE